MFKQIKAWARHIKQNIFILYFATKDDRVPWYAKVFTALVVAYAFSPIDLIPDFIPILGYLDDVILIPLGILLALKMIPQQVVLDCKKKAEEMMNKSKPKSWVAGTVILLIWGLILSFVGLQIFDFLS